MTPAVTLEDRYLLQEGRVLSTGVQASVRAIMDQLRDDRAAGRSVAGFVSGYRGSPLGGFDVELARQKGLRQELDVVLQPAINEELGATAVWGSQVIDRLPGPRVEGVLGVWYGKAPGLDRAGDALRHGNFVGAHPRGGLLALVGDDPQCKSSTLPSASEATLAALEMPIMYPGSPQEVLDMSRHAVAASRASGLWVALKLVTSVADAVATITVGPDRVAAQLPQLEFDGRPYIHRPDPDLVPPASNEMERTLHGVRLDLARAYARLNPVNHVAREPERAQIGLVAAGAAYYELLEALRILELTDDELQTCGIRILKLGMIWPLETEIVRRFAEGLEEVFVAEAKGPFIESQVRDALYGSAAPPRVTGKRDGDGRPLLSAHGDLDPEAIARALGPRLAPGRLEAVLDRLAGRAALPLIDGLPTRAPAFCSGCPHNRSTDAADGQLVGGGIGCHSMITINPAGKGSITGLTQMGGEGVQWLGQAPFISDDHLIQNMGDGTFSHSGSLAIRAAVAAGAHITFKLLYNGAVAMTGGQTVDGAMPVPVLTRWLEAEGVARVIVTTDEPDRYRGVSLAAIAEVRERSQLEPAQAELRARPGVTVLIHDQGCAAELRRMRKRGTAAVRTTRVAINERVCEGCGDCGQQSHCLSVIPAPSEFGVKTRIHQASCNTDYSCLEGHCPSFLRVEGGDGRAARIAPAAPPLSLPKVPQLNETWTVRMIGIGGTGVVTVAQILSMAAMLDGLGALGLDQTGLAQKGGPVVSDVRIVAADQLAQHSNRPASGAVDTYLGFDLLGAAASANLGMTRAGHTVAIVSTSEVQTASRVGSPSARFASVDRALAAIDTHTTAPRNVYADAQSLAERLFGDHMASNLILLGAAWQQGTLPVSGEALRQAITLNGVSVQQNLAALEWGRAVVGAPDAIAALTRSAPAPPVLNHRARALLERSGATPGSELHRLLTVRIAELIDYQSESYAAHYVDVVARVRTHEASAGVDGRLPVTEAVARQLFRLMAYKDEYEVARLHLDPAERERIRQEFGDRATVSYMLQPPLLRALGMERKVALGTWFDPAFRALHRMRALRGTRYDPFGHSEVRRTERALIAEYEALMEAALPHLAGAPQQVVVAAELPDVIRGYEQVKLRNVARFREQSARLKSVFAARGV